MKIDLFHNIRWSRYKARVFSALHRLAKEGDDDYRFFQIADTDSQRTSLSGVELRYHQYPHELLFPGSYSDVPKLKLATTVFFKVLRSDARLVLIPGFDKMEYWAMLFAAIFSGKRRATFCDSTLHDRPQPLIKGLFKRLFFRLCDGVFCYGQRAREYLLYYGAKIERIHQRCQAAALPDDYSVATARAARLRLAPPRDEPRFLYVGRLSSEKSLDVLLRAFAQVRATSPASRLILVGGGPQTTALKALTTELGQADAVEFAGGMDQDALAQQYGQATCLVLPSRSEPWGLVVNESLHYGCPVVVSDHCGCVPELVLNDLSGHVFATGDVADLADKLRLTADESADVELVADRCLTVISSYTPERTARQIMAGSMTMMRKGIS